MNNTYKIREGQIMQINDQQNKTLLGEPMVKEAHSKP